MIYLDSAAVVKLARQEVASLELRGWLMERRDEHHVSSALVEVEVPRAVLHAEPSLLPHLPALLAGLELVEIDRPIRQAAASLPEHVLRSLDAIHLATALGLLTDLSAFVSYDRRLLGSAEALGLPIASPGAQ